MMMEVKNFLWNSESVSWSYNGKSINIEYPNIIFANLDIQKNYVYIVCGKNFSEDQIHYLSFEGNQILYYDKINGKISWEFDGKLIDINCKDIIYAIREIKDELVLVISGSQQFNEKLLGFTLEGKLLFEKEPPKGYHFLYLSSVSNRPSVVCQGGKEQTDSFGRNEWHFILDMKTGEMLKSDLAY
jgi:hypothetical protein